MELINDKIVTSSELRQNFLEVASKSEFVLESELEMIESERQKAENDVKLQFSIECEMVERQIKTEQLSETTAPRVQEFLNTLVSDRVKKLVDIHIKSATLTKSKMEKFIIEAKRFNDRLRSMSTFTLQSKQPAQ